MDRRVDKMTSALINAILIEKERLGIALNADSIRRAGIPADIAERIAKCANVRRRHVDCCDCRNTDRKPDVA